MGLLYRCSCCDKIKRTNNAYWVPWGKTEPQTDVMVCKNCYDAIYSGPYRGVCDHLENKDLQEFYAKKERETKARKKAKGKPTKSIYRNKVRTKP